MKKFIFLFAATLFVMWGVQSQAAFKWSADAEQSFTYKKNYDLHTDKNNEIATRGDTTGLIGQASGDGYRFFSTLLGINGEWDLVKDTAFYFRVGSQFDWLGTNTSGPSQVSTVGNNTPGGNSIGGTNPFGLWINKLYLSFNDFAGFPVNFKFGRQNVWLGKGFVLGNRLFGAGPTIYAGGTAPSGSVGTSGNGQSHSANVGNLPLNSISGGSVYAPETSDFKGFDGVTSNLHFLNNKLNFDFGYLLVADGLTGAVGAGRNVGGTAIVNESRDIGANDDETLWFLNAGYKEKTWNAEAYFLFNHDREPLGDSNTTTPVGSNEADKIYTTGIRGDFDWGKDLWSFKNVNTYAEFSQQFGLLGGALPASNSRHRAAYAWNLGSDFTFSTSYSPWIGFDAVYFSGGDPNKIQGVSTGNGAPTTMIGEAEKWATWDPQFRGRFFTKIMDFLDSVYLTDTLEQTPNNAGDDKGRVDAGFTNRMMFVARTGFEPIKKTSLGFTYAFAQAAQPPQPGAQKGLGQEVDWDLGYQLSNVANWYFDGGVFFPGNYYSMPSTNSSSRGDKANAFLIRTGFKLNLG